MGDRNLEGGEERLLGSRVIVALICVTWLVGDWALHSEERFFSWFAWASLGGVLLALGAGALRLVKANKPVQSLARTTTAVLFGIPAALVLVVVELLVRSNGTEPAAILWMRCGLDISFLMALLVNLKLPTVDEHEQPVAG